MPPAERLLFQGPSIAAAHGEPTLIPTVLMPQHAEFMLVRLVASSSSRLVKSHTDAHVP